LFREIGRREERRGHGRIENLLLVDDRATVQLADGRAEQPLWLEIPLLAEKTQ